MGWRNETTRTNQAGFFPLPVSEAARLKRCLAFASEFSALDPCVGDGVAFTHLLDGVSSHRYGIEIDANRPNKHEPWESRRCRPTPWMSDARRRPRPCSI